MKKYYTIEESWEHVKTMLWDAKDISPRASCEGLNMIRDTYDDAKGELKQFFDESGRMEIEIPEEDFDAIASGRTKSACRLELKDNITNGMARKYRKANPYIVTSHPWYNLAASTGFKFKAEQIVIETKEPPEVGLFPRQSIGLRNVTKETAPFIDDDGHVLLGVPKITEDTTYKDFENIDFTFMEDTDAVCRCYIRSMDLVVYRMFERLFMMLMDMFDPDEVYLNKLKFDTVPGIESMPHLSLRGSRLDIYLEIEKVVRNYYKKGAKTSKVIRKIMTDPSYITACNRLIRHAIVVEENNIPQANINGLRITGIIDENEIAGIEKFADACLQELSVFVQKEKEKRLSENNYKLYLSINPIDILTLSAYTKGAWRSCHNYINGEYNHGALAYLCDRSMVAFLSKEDKPMKDIKINDNYCGEETSLDIRVSEKKWRSILSIDNEPSSIKGMVLGRHYPRYNGTLADMFSGIIPNLMVLFNPSLDKDDIGFGCASTDALASEGFSYVDEPTVVGYYKADKYQTIIGASCLNCLVCGESYDPDDINYEHGSFGDYLCRSCSVEYTDLEECWECGDIIHSGDSAYEISNGYGNTARVCPDCLEHHYIYCEVCERHAHRTEEVYVHDVGDVCYDCLPGAGESINYQSGDIINCVTCSDVTYANNNDPSYMVIEIDGDCYCGICGYNHIRDNALVSDDIDNFNDIDGVSHSIDDLISYNEARQEQEQSNEEETDGDVDNVDDEFVEQDERSA